MAKGTNQKLKLTYLTKIMMEKTDDEHSLTMPQIVKELEKYEVTAERKSIYTDFQDMNDKLGIEIIKEQVGRETYYHVGSRDFELAEVKLLIDAIQSSKFITQNKSRELIKKIKGFVSEHQAKQLQRQVFINDRVKSMNESVYYTVDYVHTAINSNRMIKFKYYRWDIKMPTKTATRQCRASGTSSALSSSTALASLTPTLLISPSRIAPTESIATQGSATTRLHTRLTSACFSLREARSLCMLATTSTLAQVTARAIRMHT